MFERYTEKARRVIFFAHYEASEYGSTSIETEHMLLGLLRADAALMQRCFGGIDSLTQIRAEVEQVVKRGDRLPTSVEVQLTSESKNLLNLAAEEAERLGHQHIRTEHILLGILRLPDSVAARLILARGANLEAIREIAKSPVATMSRVSEVPTRIPAWEEIAIPEGFGPYRLLYNPPSETVVAELRSIGEQFFPNQLYVRKKDSPKYEPIKEFNPMVSSESAVTSLERPLLFYLSNKLTKREDKGFSGDWEGLYSYDLQKRSHLRIADKHSLRFPAPYVEGWITGLVDASADATELYLTVGMMPPDTSAGFRMVNHQLARMDLTTGDIHPLSHLKGTFF